MEQYTGSKLLKDLARIAQGSHNTDKDTSASSNFSLTDLFGDEFKFQVGRMHTDEKNNSLENIKPDVQAQNLFTCDICSKTFVLSCQLIIHKKSHTDIELCQQDISGNGFKDGSSHKNRPKTKGNKYRSDSFRKHFKYSLRKCKQTLINVKRASLKTKGSDSTLFLRNKVKLEPSSCKDVKGDACTICRKQFNSAHNLRIHRVIQPCVKPHKCSICGKAFAILYRLKIHKRKHTGEVLYECDRCGTNFSNSLVLKLHKRIHLRHRPYKCSVCRMAFIQKCQLKQHARNHRETSSGNSQEKDNDNRDKLVESKTSGKTSVGDNSQTCSREKWLRKRRGKYKKPTSSVSVLAEQRRRMLASGIPFITGYPYTNGLIRIDFNNLSKLPVDINSIPEPYKSSIPKMYLTYYADMSRQPQVKKEPEEKLWKCNICGKAFKLKSNLVRHTKHHTDERPYKCDACDAGFKGSTELKIHKLIHTGEKPYKCSYCDMTFRCRSNLTVHTPTYRRKTIYM